MSNGAIMSNETAMSNGTTMSNETVMSNGTTMSNGTAIINGTGALESVIEGDRYAIPDITYYHPRNRRMKVVTIGAGMSGIQFAYKIQKV
jgi:hypothetical protein